jgi:inner membrane protein
LKASPITAFWFTVVCAASHGVLDTFTNGGLGAALWWPFSEARVFAPWQVIEVSPLSLRRVFSAKGLAVMQSELLWIWLPAVLAGVALFLVGRRRTTGLHSGL